MQDKLLGGLWGSIIGDALGVPVEFMTREELKRKPVTGMIGFGTHNQPAGTWSDDSSLFICSVEALLSGFEPAKLANLFVRWLKDGYWTPWGQVFDVGNTVRLAIERIEDGIPPEAAGMDDVYSNGNGSLMRILPIVLKTAFLEPETMLDFVHRTSAITHRHLRSQIACGIYSLIAARLVRRRQPLLAYQEAITMALEIYDKVPYRNELPYFERVLSGKINKCTEDEIDSGGYVIDTLEASIWAFLTTKCYEEAVLKAVNLGGDTDTTGIVTGGLAGIYYGFMDIPEEWLNQIARRDEIGALFDKFVRGERPWP